MANYIFIKTRQPTGQSKIIDKLEQVCCLLEPTIIKNKSQNTAKIWPEDANGFYAIQNSEDVAGPEDNALVIGWIDQTDNKVKSYSSNADGSYAVITNKNDEVSFFCDQFGSRTLWYYYDENILIVSTSQRAIVALKSTFKLNQAAIAWYLSSGCQGPFISWDQEVIQALPNLEYKLDVGNWSFDSIQKQDMSLPCSGSTKLSEYLKIYEKQVTKSLKQIVNEYANDQVLLPLSGGLDSRLLLALSKKAGLTDKMTLANWGVDTLANVFDDKKAANQIASSYGKNLLDKYLPVNIDGYDKFFEHFAEASEGRIDHFNAFTDDFEMWDDFFQSGYRTVIRGDIPYPTGICINQTQIRAKMGLELLSDYANVDKFSMQKYIKLQTENLTERLESESLIRWRDRTFKDIRVPLVHSAFSQQISAFTEIRSPMFSWSLYKLYMGLPDKKKGNKRHIQKLWKKYDRSGVSSKAVGSLNSMNSYFDSICGHEYLLHKLLEANKNGHLRPDLIDSVQHILSKRSINDESKSTIILVRQTVKRILSDYLPALPKAYLKSKSSQKLSATTLAYRIVMIDKIISMYESDARYIEVSK